MAKKRMTNAEVVNAIKYTEGNFKKKKIPVKLSYAIRKSIVSLKDVYGPYEEALNALCETYGCSVGNMAVTADTEEEKKEKQRDFNADIATLLSEENDVEIHTVDESLLEKCEDDDRYDELTYEDIDQLWWIVNDDGKTEIVDAEVVDEPV